MTTMIIFRIFLNDLLKLFLLPLFIILFVSCSNEEDTKTLIKGKWTLDNAEREGKPTNSLEGLYFNFVSDSQFNSNILGSDLPYTYELTNDRVVVQHGMIKEFEISKITDSMLSLNTRIRGETFIFNMQK